MSDDIVTQIREILWEQEKTWHEKMLEAADEIERLRAELEISQTTVRALHKLIGERQ